MALGSTRMVVFDDAGGRLWPLTDTRASFEIRTGALTTLDRIQRVFDAVACAGVFVPRQLAGVVSERLDLPVNDASVLAEPTLLINGRCALPHRMCDAALDLEPGAALVSESGAVLAAVLDGMAARAVGERGEAPPGSSRRVFGDAPLLERAWDVIRFRNDALAFDLQSLCGGARDASPGEGIHVVQGHPVRISPTARLYPGVVLDAEKGPIVIDDEAIVRPNAVVTGPAYIGPGSTVLDGAVIRAGTSIGPVCKVSGEISGAIFQGHANKAHDGFLGDSFVGEWANLGAGTITSNLLNTYSDIRACSSIEDERERTGLTFLGSIIGDHAKTAIGTRLMTGSVIGTGAMIATSDPPPTCVGNFAWLAEGRSQLYRLSKFIHVCETVMARRNLTPSDAERERLKALHDAVTRTLIAAPSDYQI